MKYKSILIVSVFLYAAVLSCLSILRFHAHNAGLVDLGRMEQGLWSILHGGLLINTFEPGNASRFIVHSEPIFFLLAPLYFVFQSTEFLLILQSIVLGGCAFLLYAISLKELKEEKISLVIALCYLLFPSLFYINIIDFHPDCFALFFTLAAFYFLSQKRWKSFWIFAVLLLSVREYYGLILAALGVYNLASTRDYKWSFFIIALGVAYFSFAFLLLPRMFPEFNSWHGSVGPITKMDSSAISILKSMFAFFMPLAFLPFLCLGRFLICLPLLAAFIFLGQFSYANHHAVAIIPFVFLAAIGAIARFNPGHFNKIGVFLILATLLSNQLYGASPASFRFFKKGDFHYYKDLRNFHRDHHDVIIDSFIRMIPDNASVSASNHIGASLARREYINFFPYPVGFSGIDYVLVDLKEKTSVPWLKLEEQLRMVELLKRNAEFQLIREEDSILLFKRRSGSC